jgi:hypothetical protein
VTGRRDGLLIWPPGRIDRPQELGLFSRLGHSIQDFEFLPGEADLPD